MNIQKIYNQPPAQSNNRTKISFGSSLHLKQLSKTMPSELQQALSKEYLAKFGLENVNIGRLNYLKQDVIVTADKSQDETLRKFAEAHNYIPTILRSSINSNSNIAKTYSKKLHTKWVATKGESEVITTIKQAKETAKAQITK